MEEIKLGGDNPIDTKLFVEEPVKEKKTRSTRSKSASKNVDEDPEQVKLPKKTKKAKVVLQSEEDIKKHQELMVVISRYASSTRFSDYLKKLGFKLNSTDVKNKSIQELEELIERVRVSINNKNNSGIMSSVVLSTANGLEVLTSSERIRQYVNFAGLSAHLRENDEFNDLMEQIELEHANLTSMSPEKRLMICLAKSAAFVSQRNKLMDTISRSRNIPIMAQPPVSVQNTEEKKEKKEQKEKKTHKDEKKINPNQPPILEL